MPEANMEKEERGRGGGTVLRASVCARASSSSFRFVSSLFAPSDPPFTAAAGAVLCRDCADAVAWSARTSCLWMM